MILLWLRKIQIVKHASSKWKRHYDTLIGKARARHLTGYSERHHVIPKCIGGSDDPENLVKLTPEEHYTAHLLLCKIYPSEGKLLRAVLMMTVDSPSAPRRNKMYGWVKRKLAEHERIRMVKWHATHTHPMLGKKQSAKSRAKIKAGLDRLPRKNAHCYDPATGKFVKTFSSVREAAEWAGVNCQTIYSCIRQPGKRTAGTYFWSYEKKDDLGITCIVENGRPKITKGKKISNRTPRKLNFYYLDKSSNALTVRTWAAADKIFEFWKNPTSSTLSFSNKLNLRNLTVYQIMQKFSAGWNPTEDKEWKSWKNQQKK